MATITATAQLVLNHLPEDVLEMRVGSAHGLSLAASTPTDGILIKEEKIGAVADDSPAATRLITGTHTPPTGCDVLAIGVFVRDTLGNRSMVYETFAEVSDRPEGVRVNQPEATDNPNEATLSWSASASI